MLYLALTEMARACGEAKDGEQWLQTARALGDFHVNPEGGLKLDAQLDLPGSHRHLSNLISIDPFNLVTIDGGERDRCDRGVAQAVGPAGHVGLVRL